VDFHSHYFHEMILPPLEFGKFQPVALPSFQSVVFSACGDREVLRNGRVNPWKAVHDTMIKELMQKRGSYVRIPAGTGFTARILYMMFCIGEIDGKFVVTRKEGAGETFFGIVRVFVPNASVAYLDAFPIPSRAFAEKCWYDRGGNVEARDRMYRIRHIWNTSGLREDVASTGITYTFEPELVQKHKAYVASRRASGKN
jgi:hypothetical protein